MLDFVLENKRDYLPRIISEVRTIDEVYSVTLNVIFFHKSNFQNELLRLQRHNKFAEHLMQQMSDLGIEGPRKHQPGGTPNFPFYYMAAQPPAYNDAAQAGAPSGPFPSAAAPVASGASAASGTAQRKESMTSLREVSSHSSAPWSASAGGAPGSPNIAMVQRRRAESRARQQLDARVLPDFGDVFEGRRDPAAANLARLQILREEAAAANSASASSVDRLAPLNRAGTMDSASTQRRRGIFSGRPRSASKTADTRSDAGGSIV